MSLDIRAIVRARMDATGIDQAALARLAAPPWGIQPDSAEHRLSRWFLRKRDITSDDLAILLDVLDLDITPRP